MVVVECWPFTREISDNRRRKCLQIPDYYRKSSYDTHTRIVYANRAPAEIRPDLYDVVEQFSFPSLVTDPGKKGVIGKLIHSSSCANFNQVQNAVSPNENPRYKTRGKVVPIFG